jgi:hypothetical protein
VDLAALKPVRAEYTPYHHGKKTRTWDMLPEDREFVAWDGEGINVDGPNKPQHYVLFGSSASEPLTSDTHIHTFDLLDYILRVGADHPTAFHVGFAFNYDSNMILRSLSERALRIIHKKNRVTLKKDGTRYHIHFLPGKWFSVSRYEAGYDRKTNPHGKTSVRIYDLFSFFGTSFVRAYEDLVGPVPDIVVAGKADRNSFSDPTKVLEYWRVEIDMLRELADELRHRMYGADLRITEWHGPGALASYANKQHGVKAHMAHTPAGVREASRFAYAGGRFEMFKLGRVNGPIYSLDINSAYPHGIRHLPSLSVGRWQHVNGPKRLAKFGVYRVRLNPRVGGSFLERAPGPLFHRDAMGNISFPWILDGWYWSPEVHNVRRLGNAEIVEGWEYTGWENAERPYEWVEDTYALRRQWKADGNASQLALKLLMNSLYGKMAQRVGWNEEKFTAPTWHQLEWAGWVTSNCRAMLWDAMRRIPFDGLIAVETDGLYTTVHPKHVIGNVPLRRTGTGEIAGSARADPAELRSALDYSSKELGGWEVEVYDELVYVQSGLAWLRKGDKWICKRRGLDARTFELDAARDYVRSLGAKEKWAPYIGETTRFVGLGAAIQSRAPTKARLGVWQTVEREIRPGQGGKRIHLASQCAACRTGMSAWDMPHDMSIRSLAYKDPQSREHDIPWENGDQGYEWRNQPDIGEVMIE